MSPVVAGFGVPHTPQFPVLVARHGPNCETAQLYRSVADHLAAVKPDVLVRKDAEFRERLRTDPVTTTFVQRIHQPMACEV